MLVEVKKDNKVITIKILQFYLELECVAKYGHIKMQISYR